MSNILILGNGAREQVLKEKLETSAENVFIESLHKNDLIEFIDNYSIDLVIPSSEHYLCLGYTDFIKEHRSNIKVFGPNIQQSKLESNKHYSKIIMNKLGIPTANYAFVKMKNICQERFNNNEFNIDDIVLKYVGLAKGKGVYLPNKNTINTCIKNVFSHGADGVLVESKQYGVEVSIMAFCNGSDAFLMPQSQDFKRKNDGNMGPNTGGMGSICPANILTPTELNKVQTHLNNVVKYTKYVGVLYAGIMKTSNGICFLEFNCRFGDPEAQTILNLLNTPLIDIMESCIQGTVPNISWKDEYSACVVLSTNEYPFSKIARTKVSLKAPLDPNVKVYNANIDKDNYTTGGRILSLVANSKNSLFHSLTQLLNNAHKFDIPNLFYRRDIGLDYMLKDPPKSYLNMAIMASNNGTSVSRLLEHEPTRSAIKIIFTNNSKASIISKALKYKIPVLVIDSPKLDYELITNTFRQFHVKLVILSGFMKIVPDTLYEDFITINVHPSLLPDFGKLMDLKVHETVLESKKPFSGCSIHLVDETIDGGPLLLQKQINIKYISEPIVLKRFIQNEEQKAIVEVVDLININKITKYEVNVEASNNFIEELKKTLPGIGGFCGTFKFGNYPLMVGSADGVGTKLDLALKHNMLDGLGVDLVAMNVNDILAGGGVPLFFMDYIAVDKMNTRLCKTLVDSIIKGCQIANIELIGGETAEMKGIYLINKFDLAGFCVGYKKHDLPKPLEMKSGDILYGIPSNGVHSNGYTLVRNIIQNDTSHIEDLLKPTRIYNEVLDLLETNGESILGIAHITGGGFKDNINRLLPSHLNYILDDWEFPSLFKYLQTKGNLTRNVMLEVFNCGYGMVIISNKEINGLIKIGTLIDI